MPALLTTLNRPLNRQSRLSTSLLQRFNDLYKTYSNSSTKSSTTPRRNSGKVSALEKNESLHFQQPIQVSLFCQNDNDWISPDSESGSWRSAASSSRQTLDFIPAPPSHKTEVKPLRPALKQTTSSNSRSTTHDLHVSFTIPTRPDSATFTMHPLFAYTHLDHAPISYNITYFPSSRSIIDRNSRAPIPYETLEEPATEPALYNQITLICDLFPWEIVVLPNASNSCTSPSKSGQFHFSRRRTITNLDVLHAIHDTLSERVTDVEWASLGHGSRVQRKISRAYEQRCVRLGGGWDSGVRRIDWLDGRTRLVGIEISPSKTRAASDVVRLVFKNPV